ncbi:MAG: Maf family protein [Phycisphaerae bacterium]
MADDSFSFILASASPRRQQLLNQAGYKFRIIPSDIDESYLPMGTMPPADYARTLALAKAKNIADKYPESLVIGADTIVDFNGEIIGKADDDKQAEQIIRKLFSTNHKVITGVAIVQISQGIEIVQSDTTIIYPRKMTEEQIAAHIKGQTWQGKAGAYAIQETGDEFVERIDGSLTNVVGLPMELLETMLNSIGKKPPK